MKQIRTPTSAGKIAPPVRYALVGLVNTALDWVVFRLGTSLLPEVAPWQVKAASFLVGTLSSFSLNAFWTFEAFRPGQATGARLALVRFVVVSLLCLGINTLTFALVSGPPLNLGWLVALAAATAASFVLGYWLNRVWTFQQQLSDGK